MRESSQETLVDETPGEAPVAERAAGDVGPVPWALERGATVGADGSTHFRVWAPSAARVAVRLLDASGGRAAEHELAAGEGGVFAGTVPGVGAGTDYRYVIDGARELPDPVSRFQPAGVHGPSRVVDPGAFRWSDGAWRGLEMADYVIYELHVGTFSGEGTFDGAIPHLRALRELGVTAVEIMPVAQFPGERNWGYDGAFPYAVQNGYGGPEGLRRLVDAAHGEGLAVVLDVVYNHLGPEGNYLEPFGPYFTDAYRTPWGRAMNYDGAGSDEVRRYAIDNALHWVSEYRVDALRLDAVHRIYDSGIEHVLAELAARVHALGHALGRRVQLIAESDLNDTKVVRPRAEHGWAFDAQWSDDLHHAVHSALTGESGGYYADFGGVAPVAAALRDPYVYGGRYSAYRRRRHGGSAAGLARDRFVVFVQNHDQVGNRAAGERLAALVPFERQKLAAALLLLSPYVPLLFMGEEYGETNPFQYFVSHGDPALVEAVREGRRGEFAAFGWADGVPDPQAEETFRRSKLDRAKASAPRHAALLALHRDLLRLRRTEPALRPGDASVRVWGGADPDEPGGGWIGVELLPDAGDGRALVAAFNLSDRPLAVPLADGGGAGRWELLLATTDGAYSDRPGVGEAGEDPVWVDGARATLPAHAAALFAAAGGD